MIQLPGNLPKILTIISVVLVLVREIYLGFFSGWKERLRQGGWFRFDRTHAALFCLLLGLMFFGDSAVQGMIQSNDHHAPTSAFSDLGHQLGRYLFVLLVGAYLAGLALGSRAACRLVFGMILTSGITALIGTIFKFTFLRARPFAGQGPLSFFNLEGLLRDERTFQSFPSGDVAIVSGAAAYLFYTIRHRFWRWLPVLVLLSTAFSRVSRNRHWPSDAVGALLIALIVARAIAALTRSAPGKTAPPA